MEKRKPNINLGAQLSGVSQANEPIYSLIKNSTKVSVFLVNGVKLSGQIIWTDDKSLILRGESDQWVLVNAIASICLMPGTFFI
jgi:RNA chaperone Hfq